MICGVPSIALIAPRRWRDGRFARGLERMITPVSGRLRVTDCCRVLPYKALILLVSLRRIIAQNLSRCAGEGKMRSIEGEGDRVTSLYLPRADPSPAPRGFASCALPCGRRNLIA